MRIVYAIYCKLKHSNSWDLGGQTPANVDFLVHCNLQAQPICMGEGGGTTLEGTYYSW